MAEFTKEIGMNLEGFNGMHDTKVVTTFGISTYETVAGIMEKAKLSVRKVTSRKAVPDDKIILGAGTNKVFKKANVFITRETKGTACVNCLAPLDQADVVAFKAKLALLKFQGEVPKNITISYENA